jgi:hypothetical protein
MLTEDLLGTKKNDRLRRFGTEHLRRALCRTQCPFGNWKFSSSSPTGERKNTAIGKNSDLWKIGSVEKLGRL